MYVKLIGITRSTLDSGPVAEIVIEHAGRICYNSQRTTPEASAQFIQARVRQGHETIIEHGSASFEIGGISRACSHQLVRHRVASFSQESQRYVDMSAPEWVIPPSIAADAQALDLVKRHFDAVSTIYKILRGRGIKAEDARFVLPNATATRLVLTANFRELLHIFRLRITPQAQWEIRHVCLCMLDLVRGYAPNVFDPFAQSLDRSAPYLQIEDIEQT